ncbi:T9SS type A sorting domain-containing protein [Hymenobacter psychrophilus]|uniref:Por secretion system C-terminal sorting domain-containing protein n=1 Tax=Hymenobacter psychrophilus TaxID=651662 RepID=A0A1H3I076_9BACT|nr:T9SS type A sorting domain-containing protein [Hymenobacter psychrophilus]SDY20855.1 Por secretion system C-terminal sorting domain-containing protein [Hymenobacter psychrophilus]
MKALLSSPPALRGQVWQRLLPLLALFVFFGTSFTAQAQPSNPNTRFTGSNIIIDPGTGNVTYDGQNTTAAPDFDGEDLGTFDVSNFNTTLLLNGGSAFTSEFAPDVINSATLTYNVTADGVSAPVTSGTIALPLVNTSGGDKSFFNDIANIDLLRGATANTTLAPGSYTVDVFFTVSGRTTRSNGTPRTFTIQTPPGGAYQATFTVTGVRPTEPPTSTTWTGGQDDNWFDPANWSNGVPNSGKDATIPDFGSGSTIQYPNIYSDAIKLPSTRETVIQNPGGGTSTVTTDVPGYDNTATGPRGASGPAQTRTFTMNGTSQAQRSITRLVVGRLNVFGDFNNQQDSFIQRENTTIAFAGTDQIISGSASGLVNVEISGGGIKDLTTNFTVQAGGVLRFINGILRTNISAVNVSFVELSPATNVNNVGIQSARIEGETDNSYLRGYVKIAEVARAGTTQDFGNIGLSLNFVGNNPGIVTVTRNTAENYTSVNNGSNSRPTIRRIFGVRPADQQTNTGGLNATLTFRYLNNELTNLIPNNQTLDESKLALFVSTSSGNTFGQLGRDALDTESNTLVKTNVTTFATFSLSEFTAPLPVTLTAFDAKRVGKNAEITWETVNELNSRGYELQVSNDGRNYRALTFVPSASPNSNQLLRYRYIDTEAGKTGVRYYRLRQIDLDGTDHYYAPKVVTFDGGAELAKAEVRAFPNPFGEVLTLTANTSVAGPAQLSVTDMTGRVVSQQAVQLTVGINDVSVPNVANLRSGIYLVRLVMPSGEAKVMRVSKQ